MKYLTLFILTLLGFTVCSQDNTEAKWVDGSWNVEVHPDSVVGVDLTKGPKTAYNVLTGEFYIFNPNDTSWIEIAVMPDFIGSGGIYDGSGIVSSNTTVDIGINRLNFKNEQYYNRLYADRLSIGYLGDPVFGGEYETEYTDRAIDVSTGTGVATFTIRTNNTDLVTSEDYIQMTLDRQEEVTYRTDVAGLEYLNFANWNGLANTSLVPKAYTDANYSRNTLLSLSSNGTLTVFQDPGPNISTSFQTYVSARQGDADPTGVIAPTYIGKTFIDTAGVDTIYMATGSTNADWVMIHP